MPPGTGLFVANQEDRGGVGLAFVRYGIGGVMVIAGIVLIAINPGGFGVDGFALAAGGGLSVLLLNFLFRLGPEEISSANRRRRRGDTSTSMACGPMRRRDPGRGNGRSQRAR
jgi:hypothetical protein